MTEVEAEEEAVAVEAVDSIEEVEEDAAEAVVEEEEMIAPQIHLSTGIYFKRLTPMET